MLPYFFINSFDYFLFFLIFVIIVTFITIGVLFYFRCSRFGRIKIIMPFLLLLIFISFSLHLTSRYYLFELTLKALAEVDSVVIINNVVASQEVKDKLYHAFENRKQAKKSGSRPGDKILLSVIHDDFEISFILRRDSRDKDLYWVFLVDSVFKSDLTFVDFTI